MKNESLHVTSRDHDHAFSLRYDGYGKTVVANGRKTVAMNMTLIQN
ncbi:MAG: hypothetical protein NXI00_07680 [Cytophagales bacterium]|nr:hypothetical protein [Cytophagales bacterium]